MSATPFIAEHGSPDGIPIVFYHGFPGSHKQATLLEPWAHKMKLRILAVDRPGYGYSEARPNGGLRDFVESLEPALHDRGVDKFHVVGVSGGNPAALVTAGHYRDRVLSLTSVGGLAPLVDAPETYSDFQRKWMQTVRRTPEFLLRPMIDQLLKGFKPEAQIDMLIARLPEQDKASLENAAARQMMLDSITLARRQGSAGLLFDLKSYVNPWPVDLDSIRCRYNLWHGEADRIVSHRSSEYLHARVPHSKLHLFPHEGHYSIPLMRAEQILTELLASNSK